MNRFTPGLFVLVTIFMVNAQASPKASFSDEENLTRGLDGVFVRSFAKDNLIVVRISGEDERAFRSELNELQAFVQKSKARTYKTEMALLIDATNELSNRLNYIYYNLIRRAVKDPDKRNRGLSFLSSELIAFSDQVEPNLIDVNEIRRALDPLIETKRRLLASYKNTQGTISFWPSSNQSRRMIMRTNFMLREAIDKAFHDYERLRHAIAAIQ